MWGCPLIPVGPNTNWHRFAILPNSLVNTDVQSNSCEQQKMKPLSLVRFSDVDINDEFFYSLKHDYKEFVEWFSKKSENGDLAYLFKEYKIYGFLYLKKESGEVLDISPALPNGKHLKIGTLKIDAHGTKLGERFMKKIFDHAINESCDDAYVTVFSKHVGLIKILQKYGFTSYATKVTKNGIESVFYKNFQHNQTDIVLNYPKISKSGSRFYMIAIYPEYHSKLLPDSLLNNESFDIVSDTSYANSIHKIYLSGLASTGKLKKGDILVVYRTTDKPGKAFYRSVATSIGVIEDFRKISSFHNLREYLRYVKPHSVLPISELVNLYKTKKRPNIIKFLYNIALPRRPIRKQLLEEVGIPESPRWDFIEISREQFDKIVQLGNANASYFVD